MKEYDYSKERPWVSALFDMQLQWNKSMEVRFKRIEQMVENLADDVFGMDDDIPNKLSGTDRNVTQS